MKQAAIIKTFLALIMCVIIVSTGCRKETVDVKPPPAREMQLMSTGNFWNPSASVYHPCFWLDGKITTLQVAEPTSAFAYGFTKQDNDVYIAGTFDGTGDILMFPCYWKNGIIKKLPTDQFGEFERCSAREVKVWNNRIYIFGVVDLRPVIWIIDPNGNIRQKWIDKNEGVRAASTMVLHNNTLVLAGDKATQTGAGYSFEVGYWQVSADGNSGWTSVENNLKYATAFAVNKSGNRIFITGERNVRNQNSLDSYMSLWSDKGHITVQPLDEIAALRLNALVPAGDGNLWLNAYDFKTHRPLVLKVSETGTVIEQLRPSIPEGLRGYCTNLANEDGKLAVGGFYVEGSYQHLWFRAGDKNFELETPYPTHASATRTSWVTK